MDWVFLLPEDPPLTKFFVDLKYDFENKNFFCYMPLNFSQKSSLKV